MKKISSRNGREIETPWLNVEEAAFYCSMSRTTFWKEASTSKIPFSGSWKNRKYNTADLDAWMESRK